MAKGFKVEGVKLRNPETRLQFNQAHWFTKIVFAQNAVEVKHRVMRAKFAVPVEKLPVFGINAMIRLDRACLFGLRFFIR